jgi:hypothetical protein
VILLIGLAALAYLLTRGNLTSSEPAQSWLQEPVSSEQAPAQVTVSVPSVVGRQSIVPLATAQPVFAATVTSSIADRLEASSSSRYLVADQWNYLAERLGVPLLAVESFLPSASYRNMEMTAQEFASYRGI